MNFKQL